MSASKTVWMRAAEEVSLPVRVAQNTTSVRLEDGEPVACSERQARLLERRGLAERVDAPKKTAAEGPTPKKASKRKEDK